MDTRLLYIQNRRLIAWAAARPAGKNRAIPEESDGGRFLPAPSGHKHL
jgi:hypothetical protein